MIIKITRLKIFKLKMIEKSSRLETCNIKMIIKINKFKS